MNLEDLFFQKLSLALMRSPSKLFKGHDFGSLGGYGNEIVIEQLTKIHGATYRKTFSEKHTTHLIIPSHQVSCNRVQGVLKSVEKVTNRQISYVNVFWVLDCVYQQKLLKFDKESNYFVDIEKVKLETVVTQDFNINDNQPQTILKKRKLKDRMYEIPIKKSKISKDKIHFIFPKKEGTKEVEPQITIKIKRNNPPEVDGNFKDGQYVLFDSKTSQFYSQMLHFINPRKDVKYHQYFHMQLVKCVKNKNVIFSRWGTTGGNYFTWKKSYDVLIDAQNEYARLFEMLTNNVWGAQFNHFKGFYAPVEFEYPENVLKVTGLEKMHTMMVSV